MSEDQVKIVIVEDEEDLADTFVAWLKDKYIVETAYSGSDAIDIIDEDTTIVLLDRKMPGVSGDDVLDHINKEGLDCKVAMITAVEPDFDIVEMGFDSYLEKPVTRDELNSVVEKLIQIDDYAEKVREISTLINKKKMLEDRKSPDELERSEEYKKLTGEIAELKKKMDRAIEDLESHQDYAVLFRTAAN